MGETISESKSSVNCLNCKTEYDGKYCPECGQSSKTEKLKIITLVKGVLEGFFDLQKPLYRTVIGLTIHPGRVVSEYAEGQRKKYANPIKYSLFVSALLILITQWRGTVVGTAKETFVADPSAPEFITEFMINFSELMDILMPYTQIMTIVGMPFIALLFFLFFKKFKYSFAEHMAFGFFIFGHLHLFQCLLMGFNLHNLFFRQFVAFLNIFPFIYVTWCAITFNKTKIFSGILRSVLTWIFYIGLTVSTMVLYVIFKMKSG
jgi:Protein of unknown function (DUF3667)